MNKRDKILNKERKYSAESSRDESDIPVVSELLMQITCLLRIVRTLFGFQLGFLIAALFLIMLKL